MKKIFNQRREVFRKKKKKRLQKLHKRHVDLLEQISGLSVDEAKKDWLIL